MEIHDFSMKIHEFVSIFPIIFLSKVIIFITIPTSLPRLGNPNVMCEHRYKFYRVNFANPDMCGHTGLVEETSQSIHMMDAEVSWGGGLEIPPF